MSGWRQSTPDLGAIGYCVVVTDRGERCEMAVTEGDAVLVAVLVDASLSKFIASHCKLRSGRSVATYYEMVIRTVQIRRRKAAPTSI